MHGGGASSILPEEGVEVITEAKMGRKAAKLLKKLPPEAAFSKESLNKQLLFMAKHLDKYRNFWQVEAGQ